MLIRLRLEPYQRIASITTTEGLDPTFLFCNASDSGTGGSATVAAYQINTGLDTTISGNGWNAGLWGGIGNGGTAGTSGNISGWADASNLSASGQMLRIWSS